MAKIPLNNQMLDAALAYAARGWPVFPLKPGGKTPQTSHGLRDASTFARQIKVWWAQWPLDNVCVDCRRADLVVIDIDPDKGGMITWSALDAGAPTLTSRTAGSGFHFEYAQPEEGTPVRSSAGRLGPGVEVWGAGGYIVLPLSLHESGRRYEWLSLGGQHGSPRAVAPVPVSLLARQCSARLTAGGTTRIRPSMQKVATADPYVQAALRGEGERIRLARDGTRNDTLNRAVFTFGQLARTGMLAQGPVKAALAEAALAAGLDEPEARRTFGSGFYAGLQGPRVIRVPALRSHDLIQSPPTRRMLSGIHWSRHNFRQSAAPCASIGGGWTKLVPFTQRTQKAFFCTSRSCPRAGLHLIPARC